jgi:hypothetical protein
VNSGAAEGLAAPAPLVLLDIKNAYIILFAWLYVV